MPPRPHELLSTYYRAADVCLVPSRSESFGLVALEAAACGTPVVASDVGGLRSLVDHGRTGYLVEEPDPEAYAAWVRQILAEPLLAERLSTGSVLRARRYTWARAAHLLVDIYADLTAGRLVECRDRRVGGRPGPAERDAVCARIDAWAARELAAGGALVAVDRQVGGDPVTGAPRWYLRLRGEEKEFVTVWLTLRQRTLRHEAQFMPAPETNVEATWQYLLKRNADLVGLSFALGAEDAVYLVGRVPVSRVDDDELDRIVGSSLAYTDECFPTAMSLGYEGRYRRRPAVRALSRPCRGPAGPGGPAGCAPGSRRGRW